MLGITLVMSPRYLARSTFTLVDSPRMPNGKESSAYTSYSYETSDWKAEQKDGSFALPNSLRVTVTPTALLWKGSVAATDKAKFEKLLAHEQLHYDVAYVVGRVAVSELGALRTSTEATLKEELDRILELHFVTRAGPIQKRIDHDTRGGLNPQAQRHWQLLMSMTLAKPNLTTIGGLKL